MNKKITALLLASIISSCAYNSGVVPIGNEEFFISKQAKSGFKGLANLKAEAIQEGTQFCNAMNKEFELVTPIAEPSNISIRIGSFPRVEITFLCK